MRILIVFALLSLSAHASPDPALTNTTSGAVKGLHFGELVTFRGIPYATPPIGNLRFSPTVPPSPWKGELDASEFGPPCPQPPLFGGHGVEGSEDCLTLNVWRPANGANLPLMIFIHGGGNSVGSGSSSNYNGAALAIKGSAVIVTLNYRLGALGFLAHPALSKERQEGVSGNYALYDQLQAIRWMKANASAFGANGENITVFGESAGAIDILALLASPSSSGLFQRAIIESGFLTEQPLAAAEADGIKFARSLGCETAQCLRGKSIAELIGASDLGYGKLHAYAATIEGHLLPASVLETFRSGRAPHLPLILGTNQDEMSTLLPFVSDVRPTLNKSDYEQQLVKDLGPATAARVLAVYPASDYLIPYSAYLNVASDSYAHCPARRIARASGGATFRYVFTHVSDNPLLAPFGAGHALELPFVFHDSAHLSWGELDLSDKIIAYWANFARNGNPNGDALTEWKPFRNGEYLELNQEPKTVTGFREAKCDLWDSIAP